MLRHAIKRVVASQRRANGFQAPIGAFLGVSTGTLLLAFSAHTIYLDSQYDESSREITPGADRGVLSALKRRKSIDFFDHRQQVDVHSKLSEFAETHFPDAGSGIRRYDIVQVSSNDPNEDDHSVAILPHPKGTWSFFAVLDGHSGWETSAWLRENMIPALVGSLADLHESYYAPKSLLTYTWNFLGRPTGTEGPNSQSIDETIKKTFVRLDDDIVHWAVERVFASPSKHAGLNLLAPAYSGSCALLAFFDSQTRLLRVAITGDSRAILGRRTLGEDGEVKYTVHVLSVDQNADNLLEVERLNNSPEHPGEEVIKNGRVLGMGMSRAFGDARWKWSAETQKRLKEEYLGRSKPGTVKTPPYLTAEPVITTFKVEQGDFLIMGTDGLWECLQNEEAVGLVGAWLDCRARETGVAQAQLERSTLPVILPEHDDTVRYRQWAAKKSFVNIDGNAATHLARNALGGGDSDLAQALMSMRTPRSRTYRDDITALVVFFDDHKTQ